MPKDNSGEQYYCSITGQIMIDPVVASDGYTYEREAIEKWFKNHNTSPRTNLELKSLEVTENRDKRSEILEFLEKNPELYSGNAVYLPQAWMTQLVIDLKNKNEVAVQSWLSKDRRLLTRTLEGNATALHLACEFGSVELVDTLLKIFKQKNELPSPGSVGFKPDFLNILLKNALGEGDYDKCALLLRLGANLEQPEASTQNTLLHQMVIAGKQEAVSWLLEQKADLESCNGAGNTPLLLSVIHNHPSLSAFLLDRHANVQVKNLERQSPILIALLNSSYDILCRLVGKQKAALLPLHLALAIEDNDMLKALLAKERGAIDGIDKEQRTPFYCAIENSNLEAAKLLLAAGANPVMSCGTAKLNVLHVAAARGDVATLEYLLSTKAAEYIDAQNSEGDTPLHLAVRMGHETTVSLLLLAGAYHKIKNVADETAIELARIQQKPEMMNLIVETVRQFKQAKLKETKRLNQLVLTQSNEIKRLKELLDRQSTLNEEHTKMAQDMGVQAKQLRFTSSDAAASKTSNSGSSNSVVVHMGLPSTLKIPNADEKDAREFLKLIAEGEQDKAEAMLKKNPALVLVTADVTDLSKRTFKNITALQYALWALDWHMWTMLLKYIPPEAVTEQVAQSTSGSWVCEHGVTTDWQGLVRALNRYASGVDIRKTWIEEVGGAQLLLPAHVINEYCRKSRSFYPTPDFAKPEATGAWRTRAILDGDWFSAESRKYSGELAQEFLAREFAVCRGTGTRAIGVSYAAGVDFKHDITALVALFETRTSQRRAVLADQCSPQQKPTQEISPGLRASGSS